MAERQDIKAYHRRKNVVRLINIVFGLVYAVAWCWIAPPLAERLAGVVDIRWVVLLLVGAAIYLSEELILMPLTHYTGYTLEHRYDLSNETVGAWLIRQAKELGLGCVLGGILLAGLYALLWYGGSLWWLWVWLGWIVLAVGLTQLFPVLILPIFYKAEPIEDEALAERLTKLAEGSGIRVEGVYRLGLSAETKKPNAALTGLGSTRRVMLSDTLLDGFDADEIETVFVHELGHHTRGHIPKGIAMSAGVASVIIAGIVWRLGPYAGSDPSLWPQAVGALPQVLVISALVGLIIRPGTNAIMRWFERQADRDALDATGPQTYRSAFEKLAKATLSDPDPSRAIEIFFYDHPPIAKRIAMADEVEGTPAP